MTAHPERPAPELVHAPRAGYGLSSTAPVGSPRSATPPRPDAPLATPEPHLTARVEVHTAHLANPLVAVARLLASEAQAVARVTGDERCFDVTVALPDASDTTLADTRSWMQWAIHNAGVRGHIRWSARGG